ncbi:MAG: A/G-specific adenine glycosylase [Opitutaceae bacterium]|nr:A/G-specific adenine glycosylase [Opitutaceae bacterium]
MHQVQRPISRKAAFQRALHAWYRRHHRRLPWRESPSLYGTVVSEFMLQQTQIKTVLPYFARWMRELPGFAALAAASEAWVLKLWEGLGYYSRARNLHRLARALAALPAPPRTPEAWRELPGVGPYTAAAIASLAFDAPAACVDGNVVRVLARLTADGTRFRDSASAAKHFAPLAGVLLKRSDPGTHNQAMMELGALVCTRHHPGCASCPVRRFCAAARRGAPERYPRLERKKTGQRTVARAWCEHDGCLLLHRAAGDARRLADLHELPTADQLGFHPTTVQAAPLLARHTRTITNHRITESIHAVALTPADRRRLAANATLHWVHVAELEHITLSGPHRRWIQELLLAGRR